MGLQRFLMQVIANVNYRKFYKASKNMSYFFDKNWKDTYEFLSKSDYWKGKIRSSLTENPVTEYKDYEKAFKSDMESGKTSFGNETVVLWALSGGTSGPPKYFPITKTYQKQFQKTTPPFLAGILKKYKSFIDLPVLYITSTNPVEFTPNGTEIGYISNYNYRNIPGFLKSKYVLPDQVLRNGESFERYAHLYCLASDLSAMIAVTPLSLQQFLNRIFIDFDKAIKEIEDPDFLPAGLPKFKISDERLAHLKKCSSERIREIKKIWPSIEFVCCWKTSTCAYQLKNIENYLKGLDVIDATYSATEGWMNIPFPEGDKFGGPYHPEAVLLEFSNPGDTSNLLRPWELRAGKDYEVYITNKMGLVRYRLFDIVKCTGHFNESPIIEFVSKAGQQISLGMCVLAESELLAAMDKMSIKETDFLFCPNEKANALALYTSKDFPKLEVARLDKILKDSNINYQKYRDSGQLGQIEITQDDNNFWIRKIHGQTKPKFLYQRRPW